MGPGMGAEKPFLSSTIAGPTPDVTATTLTGLSDSASLAAAELLASQGGAGQGGSTMPSELNLTVYREKDALLSTNKNG